MRSSSQSKTSRASVFFLLGWLTGTLAIGLWLALQLHDKGMTWVTSILLGASVSVAVSWFSCFLIWHIWMRISRGAPFYVGDQVVITAGPHKGEVGEVRKICEGRCSVWISLERGGDSSDLLFFDWDQIRRSGRSKNIPLSQA
jgi:hypothetical protein